VAHGHTSDSSVVGLKFQTDHRDTLGLEFQRGQQSGRVIVLASISTALADEVGLLNLSQGVPTPSRTTTCGPAGRVHVLTLSLPKRSWPLGSRGFNRREGFIRRVTVSFIWARTRTDTFGKRRGSFNSRRDPGARLLVKRVLACSRPSTVYPAWGTTTFQHQVDSLGINLTCAGTARLSRHDSLVQTSPT
jgi:hypothetical protein